MQKKRSKDLRKIQRESKKILRKYCNSKNIIADMAAEVEKQEYGSDSDKSNPAGGAYTSAPAAVSSTHGQSADPPIHSVAVKMDEDYSFGKTAKRRYHR